MKIFNAPEQIEFRNRVAIFLAGTIDMGASEDWQTVVSKELSTFEIDIYNPRRDFWNDKEECTIGNPIFYQQVNWEINALERCDYIILNLLPDSKSPISLLEMGLFANDKKLVVCCPKEFYRSGNVHIVCDRCKIPCFQTMPELLTYLKQILRDEIQ